MLELKANPEDVNTNLNFKELIKKLVELKVSIE